MLDKAWTKSHGYTHSLYHYFGKRFENQDLKTLPQNLKSSAEKLPEKILEKI